MKFDEKFLSEVDKAKSLKDIFRVYERYFHCENELTMVQKIFVVEGLKKMIKLINPKLK